MKSVFLSLLFVEVLVIVDLGVYIHYDDQVVLGLVSDGNSDDVLAMDVYDVLDYLGLIIELIGPDGFLFVGFEVLEDDGSAREVQEFRVGD